MENVLLTPAEASYITGCSQAAAKRAVKDGVVAAAVRRKRRPSGHVFGWPELRYLTLAHHLRHDLKPAGRRRLYRSLCSSPHPGRVRFGEVWIDPAATDRKMERKMALLKRFREFAVPQPGGEAVMRGTDVSVYAVAAALEYEPPEAIVGDYPALRLEDVRDAVEYVAAFPWRGREPWTTRPPRTRARLQREFREMSARADEAERTSWLDLGL